jgi:AcrR family transcriptional regulator
VREERSMTRRERRPRDDSSCLWRHDNSADLWSRELGQVAQSLLTSAVRCFAENGFHATTTRDISHGAALSPAALYVHFPSKEAVLYEIARSSHERALAHISEPAREGAGSAEDRLRALVSRYTAWHARYHLAARVSQYELAGLTAEHYDEIRALRRETNALFRSVVADCAERRALTPAELNRLVRSMLSLSIDLVRWYRLGGADSPEELGEFHADLALKMVGTPRSASGARR